MNGDDLEKELRDAFGYGDEPEPVKGWVVDAIALLIVCIVVGVAVGSVWLEIRG